jgi:hypothetical protein
MKELCKDIELMIVQESQRINNLTRQGRNNGEGAKRILWCAILVAFMIMCGIYQHFGIPLDI